MWSFSIYCITGIFPGTFITPKMMNSAFSRFFPGPHTAALILDLAIMLPSVLPPEHVIYIIITGATKPTMPAHLVGSVVLHINSTLSSISPVRTGSWAGLWETVSTANMCHSLEEAQSPNLPRPVSPLLDLNAFYFCFYIYFIIIYK